MMMSRFSARCVIGTLLYGLCGILHANESATPIIHLNGAVWKMWNGHQDSPAYFSMLERHTTPGITETIDFYNGTKETVRSASADIYVGYEHVEALTVLKNETTQVSSLKAYNKEDKSPRLVAILLILKNPYVENNIIVRYAAERSNEETIDALSEKLVQWVALFKSAALSENKSKLVFSKGEIPLTVPFLTTDSLLTWRDTIQSWTPHILLAGGVATVATMTFSGLRPIIKSPAAAVAVITFITFSAMRWLKPCPVTGGVCRCGR